MVYDLLSIQAHAPIQSSKDLRKLLVFVHWHIRDRCQGRYIQEKYIPLKQNWVKLSIYHSHIFNLSPFHMASNQESHLLHHNFTSHARTLSQPKNLLSHKDFAL